jgi:hypothetical protein
MFTVGAAEKERLPAIAMERKRSFIVKYLKIKNTLTGDLQLLKIISHEV